MKQHPDIESAAPSAIRKLEIMFLPGLLNDHRLWWQQIDGLSDIAHGSVADLSTAGSMPELASSVLAQAPAGSFFLAGLSMGGYVALEIMRQCPQRILGLALLDTSARPDTAQATAGRRQLMQQSESDFDGVIEQLLTRLLHPRKLDDAIVRDTCWSMAKALGPEVFRRQQEVIIGRIDSRPLLHQISCPTLVLCGRDDQITPVEVHVELAERIAGAHLSIIEDCGHLSPLEHPCLVTRKLRSWLEEIQKGYGLR